MMATLAKDQDEAKRILEEVRKVAAEQGVSQQAHYFAQESIEHDKEAKWWRNWTVVTAGLLVAYVAATAFLHKWSFLAPTNTYETVQLALSKALAFIVLAFLLLMCARNFFSHKHNAIVNKHRQNALLTFKALVDAAGSEERRDVILTYAASCIFSPQETGYAKGSGAPDMPLNIIQALPKVSSGGATPQ
jgi:membrane protein implicated in regulation of membrane protease activity